MRMSCRWVAIAAIAWSAAPTAYAKKVDPLAVSLHRLADAAHCTDKTSVWRTWCIATDFYSGTADALPTKPMVGLTIELEDGKDVAGQLRGAVSLSAFIAGTGKAKLNYVKPTNDSEKKSIAIAVGEISAVMKGRAKVAHLPADLVNYLGGLAPEHAVTGGSEWTWSAASESRARKVGAFWVVVETPPQGNGYFVTILTDAWTAEPR